MKKILIVLAFLLLPTFLPAAAGTGAGPGIGQGAGPSNVLCVPTAAIPAAFGAAAVHAAANVPVTVDIPVRYIAPDPQRSGREQTSAASGTARTLRLTPDAPGTPMPADAADGAKEIVLRDAGEISFGEITYLRPDVYDYTVNDSDGSIFHVRVIAMNDGQGSLIITREGEAGKTELVFREQIRQDPETEHSDAGAPEEKEDPDANEPAGHEPLGASPRTGDSVRPLLAAIGILSALGAGAAAAGRGRRKERG